MDFTKFVSMLDNSGLYFSRADLLGDPFEGSFSKGNEKLRPIVYANTPITFDAIKSGSEFAKRARLFTFINCWHMNDHESAAMWKLYAKTNEAVAVKSKLSILLSELSEKIYVGMVKYIDYGKDWTPEGNALSPFIHKRLSFKHENEIRALFCDAGNERKYMNENTAGIWEKTNLSKLIEAIYVSPTSPEWFRILVENACTRYGLMNKAVIRSSLDEAPFF